MRNTMKRSRPEMDASDRNERSLVDIVADIESRSKDQSRDLDLLRERVYAVMAQKEEIAARLSEAVGDLAKTRAAPESERRKRETSEAKPGSVKAAMSAARAALDMVIDGDPESAEPENTLTGHENDGAAEAVIVTGDDPLVLLSEGEREALDELAARAGFVDTAALIRALCRRAIADAQPPARCEADITPPLEPDVT